jgi:hypothetical protein
MKLSISSFSTAWPLAGVLVLAMGALPLGGGCAEEVETPQAEVKEAGPSERRGERNDGWEAMSSEERMAAVQERMKAAIESGRADEGMLALRMAALKVKEYGSEDQQAELEAIKKAFTAEKQRVRAGLADESIEKADGEAQLDALHEGLREDFEALANGLE